MNAPIGRNVFHSIDFAPFWLTENEIRHRVRLSLLDDEEEKKRNKNIQTFNAIMILSKVARRGWVRRMNNKNIIVVAVATFHLWVVSIKCDLLLIIFTVKSPSVNNSRSSLIMLNHSSGFAHLQHISDCKLKRRRRFAKNSHRSIRSVGRWITAAI